MATIAVKNIPAFVPDEAVRQLLEHFGATAVRRLPVHGKYMGMAFAEFASKEEATAAAQQLTGLRLGNCCVIAELVSPDEAVASAACACDVVAANVEPVAPLLGLNHEADTSLEYVYPPATPDTVHNIAQAILAVPRLYTQVLHLMNKMNLPAPFHARDLEAIPALTLEQRRRRAAKRARGLEPDESELSSEGEEQQGAQAVLCERCRKLQAKQAPSFGQQWKASQPVKVLVATCEAREVASQQSFHQTPPRPRSKRFRRGDRGTLPPSAFQPHGDNEQTARQGLYPRPGVITLEELQERRAPAHEIEHLLPTAAEEAARGPDRPNRVLYVKNLAKSVQESDLRYVFHIFFPSEEEAQASLHVRVMQGGRMRRQAFVTFPSAELASHALKQCNGIVIDGKPIVMQFARSSP